MAVSKELLARYKELKAQGVSITLSELKAQMEAENSQTTEVQTPTTQKPSEFGALSSYETPQNQSVPQPDFQENCQQQQETSSPVQSEYYTKTEYYTSNEQVSSWSTSYYQEPKSEEPTTEVQPQQPLTQPYSGNVVQNSTIDTNSYNNNFNADFSWQNQNYQASSQAPEQKNEKYTGNLPPQSSFFSPTVVNGAQNDNIQHSPEQTKYCLIGYPLGHSLSSYIHNAGFKSLGIDTNYEILETPPDDLVDRIKYLKYNGYAGFNVTIPLKLPVTLFLDYIDASADLVGAVNTVVISADKTLKGYNTDVIGFRNAIPSDFTLTGKVAGVLGTGGAARAAITALAQANVKEIKIYTRNIPNCAELISFLRNKFTNITFNVYQIEYIRDLSEVQILINTTPIGMQGRSADMTPVEEAELKTLPQGALVYDVIYNPKKTLLLRLAERNGYRIINGVDMFIHQAVAAEKIWTGRTPDFKDMKIAALENL